MAGTAARTLFLSLLLPTLLFPALSQAESAAGNRAVGDTLTVVMRPILSVPEIVTPGGSFTIEAVAPQTTSDWAASLVRGNESHALSVDSASYETGYERWFLTASVPSGVPEEMYALELSASGGIYDEVAHAVMVRQSVDSDFYFVHITDTHLPTHLYYYQEGADTDTTEMDDLRAVINDVNLMNPAFVLLTGDVINEGELEDFLDKRYFTRAQRILQEFDVPVFVSAGNHDIGGWDDTPPSDGTARRNWWKFFGWPYLDDPPTGDNYTQDYSFDYGGTHFVSLEAYNNYDRWRRTTYGSDSFTGEQLSWIASDVAALPPDVPVVAFYHMDFQDQLSLSSLGIDGALWGHIHYSSGNENSTPFNLATETVCDGERAMRVVHVSGGTVTPSEPTSAGSIGRTMYVSYDVPNDGTATENTASVVNGHPETFNNGRIVFLMDASEAPYEADNGTLIQTTTESGVARCYVDVQLADMSITDVHISPATGSGAVESGGTLLSLRGPAFPNPARNGSNVAFALEVPGYVTVDIYDVAGRLITTAFSGRLDAGEHVVEWNLSDAGGTRAAAGIYLFRVSSGDESRTGKLVVLR